MKVHFKNQRNDNVLKFGGGGHQREGRGEQFSCSLPWPSGICPLSHLSQLVKRELDDGAIIEGNMIFGSTISSPCAGHHAITKTSGNPLIHIIHSSSHNHAIICSSLSPPSLHVCVCVCEWHTTTCCPKRKPSKRVSEQQACNHFTVYLCTHVCILHTEHDGCHGD